MMRSDMGQRMNRGSGNRPSPSPVQGGGMTRPSMPGKPDMGGMMQRPVTPGPGTTPIGGGRPGDMMATTDQGLMAGMRPGPTFAPGPTGGIGSMDQATPDQIAKVRASQGSPPPATTMPLNPVSQVGGGGMSSQVMPVGGMKPAVGFKKGGMVSAKKAKGGASKSSSVSVRGRGCEVRGTKACKMS